MEEKQNPGSATQRLRAAPSSETVGRRQTQHEEDMFSEELPSQGAPMLPPKGLKTTGGPDCGKGFSSD